MARHQVEDLSQQAVGQPDGSNEDRKQLLHDGKIGSI